jgi:hypothetical protein
VYRSFQDVNEFKAVIEHLELEPKSGAHDPDPPIDAEAAF